MGNEIDGLHLIVDGSVKSPDSFFTVPNLKAMILQLAKDLKMQIIFGPVFHDVEIDESKLTGDVFQDEGGVSGFCMIGTSHISVHVWPLRRHFSMDVYSCKQFDKDLAEQTIRKYLEPAEATFIAVRRRQGGVQNQVTSPYELMQFPPGQSVVISQDEYQRLLETSGPVL